MQTTAVGIAVSDRKGNCIGAWKCLA